MSKLIIDGKEYELPTSESMTIGESRIVKRYTGVAGQGLQDLAEGDPDLTAAMIHIAFMRENPAQSYQAIEKRVDDVKYSVIDFTDDVEELSDEDPPEAPKPENVGQSGGGARTQSSGIPSIETSENSDEILDRTGALI